jgi:imidazolonepropionase-like amidohydrolase
MLPTDTNTTSGFIWIIHDRKDLEAKWAGILASNPDFIKVILAYSDQYDRRLADSTTFNWRGIDPRLLPEIVKRAHATGRRVMAHVETAADFRNALHAGVDEIGHIPGFRGNEQGQLPNLKPYTLTDSDAAEAARRGTFVVTTLGGIVGVPDTALRKKADAFFAENLRMLRKHKVRVIIGSDSYRTTSQPEALYLSTLRVYSNAELLRMWSEATPRAIFPGRRIGRLVPGYEASFIVLASDPLSDFANVKTIALLVKQGNVLSR